jgi:hypothetical protein
MPSLIVPHVRALKNNDPKDPPDSFAIFIFSQERTGEGMPSYNVNPLAFTNIPSHTGDVMNAALLLSREAAQALVEDLYKGGIRQTEMREEIEDLKLSLEIAKQDHLADLRKVVSLALH